MEYFISNLEKSLSIEAPLLSLTGVFTLIDAMAALDSDDGTTSPKKFTDWMKVYLPGYLQMGVTAEDFYQFKCALLHQPYQTKGIKLLFFPGNSPVKMHMNRMDDSLQLDTPTFVKDVIESARRCMGQSSHYQKHKNKGVNFFKDGLSPYIHGVAVIGLN